MTVHQISNVSYFPVSRVVRSQPAQSRHRRIDPVRAAVWCPIFAFMLGSCGAYVWAFVEMVMR
jgi:hypothetical protein